MHNVVVANNSRFTYDSDSDDYDDDDDDDDDDDIPQRACAPIQRACAPSNNNNDIDNFCITDETPFSSENVNTILKSFTKL